MPPGTGKAPIAPAEPSAHTGRKPSWYAARQLSKPSPIVRPCSTFSSASILIAAPCDRPHHHAADLLALQRQSFAGLPPVCHPRWSGRPRSCTACGRQGGTDNKGGIERLGLRYRRGARARAREDMFRRRCRADRGLLSTAPADCRSCRDEAGGESRFAPFFFAAK